MGKFIQTPERPGEEFTPSMCNCLECTRMEMASREWDSFTPKTALQRRMKNVVSNIELTIKKNKVVKRIL